MLAFLVDLNMQDDADMDHLEAHVHRGVERDNPTAEEPQLLFLVLELPMRGWAADDIAYSAMGLCFFEDLFNPLDCFTTVLYTRIIRT